MKVLISSVFTAGCLAASAQAQLGGPFWYAGLHGGYYEVTEKGFGASVEIFDGISFGFEAEDRFDSGYAVGGVFGRQLTPWFGVEGEYTLRNAPFSYTPDVGDDDLETHAFFANLIFRWPTSKPIEVYGAIGGGYVANNYDLLLDNQMGEPERVSTFSNSLAFQLKGGADWFISDRQSLGLEIGWHRGEDATAEVKNETSSEEYFFEVGGVTALVTMKRRF